MNDFTSTAHLLHTLREAGAAHVEPVDWHYIETLAARIGTQPEPVQRLLQDKLKHALGRMQKRVMAATSPDADNGRKTSSPSPMALLLQEMVLPAASSPVLPHSSRSSEGRRMWQFRQQLSRISLQKQVSQAIAQAPQNAGPINSHMLVLRAVGLMQEISPDYLNRFMTQVDTLLCLDHAERTRQQPRKAAQGGKTKNKA